MENKNQLHLYIMDSTKENLDRLTDTANTMTKKRISRNDLVGIIITEFINNCVSEDELKDLLIKYLMA